MAFPKIYQCDSPHCRFRFPVTESGLVVNQCPRCGAPTHEVDAPFISHTAPDLSFPAAGPVVEVLLDNIRSVYNVGSMFRTADAAGIRFMHLCGMTSPPTHHKIPKTALGAEKTVPWCYYPNGVETAVSLKQQGYRLWAIEGGETAEPLFSQTTDLAGPPIVLVVGNEVVGVDPHLLQQCERVLWIPMQGLKHSLNVAIAFGIAVYTLRYALRLQPGIG